MVGVFFVYNLEPNFGGVETHQKAFIEHFFVQSNWFDIIVEKNARGCNVHIYSIVMNNFVLGISLGNHLLLYDWLEKAYPKSQYVFFLNDPWWIEDVPLMRSRFPNSLIIMRSGGNDVEKAPCNLGIYPYEERRKKYKEFINTLDYIIVNSNYSLLRLGRLGVDREKVIKIRGGVNTSVVNKLKLEHKGDVESLRKELLLDKQYVILYACRFVQFKGIQESLLSLSLSKIADDSRIILLGDGPLKGEIENFCQSHFAPSQVSFVGVVNNHLVLKYMAASDVVVNCSIEVQRKSGDGSYIHTETMGRTMMEAICVGTHIIATDVGGISELFQENKDIGILIKPNTENITEAFNMIPQMIEKPTIRLIDYSWTQVFREYERIINEHDSTIESH